MILRPGGRTWIEQTQADIEGINETLLRAQRAIRTNEALADHLISDALRDLRRMEDRLPGLESLLARATASWHTASVVERLSDVESRLAVIERSVTC